MSDHGWEWRERGSAIIVDTPPGGGGLRVEVYVDGHGGRGVILPERAVDELAEWLDSELDEGLGYRLAEIEAELATVEGERDAALRKLDHLEHLVDALRAKLVEAEQRAHGFEHELERVQAMVAEAVAIGIRR